MNKLIELEQEFSERYGKLKSWHCERLKELLSTTGYDKDVIQRRSGLKGRLVVFKDYYSSYGYEIRFYKYTKSGELSMLSSGRCWDLNDYEIVEEGK